MKQIYTNKEHFDDFWKIIQRHYLHKFEWYKLTLDDYLKMGTIERANKFALPKGLLKRMGRFVDETGKRQLHAMRFIRQLTEQGKVIYHAKVTRVYAASGKRFDLPPWIEITPNQIQLLLAESKAGKFELTARQKKLVARYFPRNDKQPEDENMQDQIHAANVPQEDEMPHTAPCKETPRPKMQSVPSYADAMREIDIELHAMRDATTKDDIKAAYKRLGVLLSRYAPLWPDRCARKSQDAKYYVGKFKARAAA